ncbi:hypothetical protein BDZ97DRAFT_1779294 [Flammula alnicola]|nr:hypothetical protein BDZ97DRAFT_1779294 [Flammula alnicola]
MPVTVRWGTDRFEFQLPAPDTQLAAIRNSIAQYTHLPYNAFNIVHDGAVMADDNAPISLYHLRPNSTISIVADKEMPVKFKNSEQAQIASIQAELAAVNKDLLPAHSQFLRDLATYPKQSLSKEHSRIAELLLQALLRLDGIVPEQNWQAARADRKAAVKQLQGLLDQLDNAWADTT